MKPRAKKTITSNELINKKPLKYFQKDFFFDPEWREKHEPIKQGRRKTNKIDERSYKNGRAPSK